MRAGVLIVDDHADFRESARTMLESAGYVVVGEAADGSEAMAAEARLHPALILLDIQLPDMDGFQLAEELSQTSDPPVVVLVSTRDADAYGDRVAMSRAVGFITKFELSGPSLAKIVG